MGRLPCILVHITQSAKRILGFVFAKILGFRGQILGFVFASQRGQDARGEVGDVEPKSGGAGVD